MQSNVRWAIRSLARTPRFSFAILGLIALSTGLSTTVFSVLDAVYLSATPYRDPASLVLANVVEVSSSCVGVCERGVPASIVETWPRNAGGVQALAGLTVVDEPLRTAHVTSFSEGAMVTPNIFEILGLRPLFGRAFSADDNAPGAPNVVTLSYALWREAFDGDTNVVGQSVSLGGVPYRIIAVMPREDAVGAPLAIGDQPTMAFFIPIGPVAARGERTSPGILPLLSVVVGRMIAGARIEALRSNLDVKIGQLRSTKSLVGTRQPGRQSESRPATVWRARVRPLRQAQAQAFTGSDQLLFAAVLGLTFVASLNLATLFVARLMSRGGEIKLRLTLGALYPSLIRLYATEAVLVTVVGGAFGLLMADAGAKVAAQLLPAYEMPYWTGITLNGRVFLFSAALTAAIAVIFGVLPLASLLRPHRSIADGRIVGTMTSPFASRLRQFLAIAQLAGTMVMLTEATLLGETFLNSLNRDLGFSRHSLLEGSLYGKGDSALATLDEQRNFDAVVLQDLLDTPGIADASLRGSATLLSSANESAPLGKRTLSLSQDSRATALSVTPNYFRVAGVPVLIGRAFTVADGPSTKSVAIVDSATSRRFFRNENPIGRQLPLRLPTSNAPISIVGVVRTMRRNMLSSTDEYEPMLYVPMAQSPAALIHFSVRPTAMRVGSDAALKPAVQGALHKAAPSVPIAALLTVEDLLGRQLAPLRLDATVFTVLACFGTVLTLFGLYGLMAHTLAQRKREFAIRSALGATPKDIRRLFVRSTTETATYGLSLGLLGAWIATPLVRLVVPQVGPMTLRLCALVGASIVLVLIVASWLPILEAGRVDAATALRS